MSALRCAATKLVGLRATVSPASQAQQRRLLPRLLHSSPALEIQKELRTKKEELYNLLAKLELNPYLRDNCEFGMIDRYQNKRLLRQLSVQIEPRWNDLDWRWFQLAQKISFYWTCGASYVTVCTFWHYALGGQNDSQDPKGASQK
ncbi:uncharacterized protein [Lolium perenne]|uniref:uncharacterized protein n=1 Tax=Lolium perenne TaxID=4522 RepID=UPI0021EA7E3D|nr:uncharacterized protein LOC127336394 [Lolium perenne]